MRHLPNHGYAAEAREVTISEHGGCVRWPRRGKRRWRWPGCAEGPAGTAQRFLIKDGATIEMPFERIRGRIDSEGVVVDGRLVTWDEFLELLQPHEGWEFDLRIPPRAGLVTDTGPACRHFACRPAGTSPRARHPDGAPESSCAYRASTAARPCA